MGERGREVGEKGEGSGVRGEGSGECLPPCPPPLTFYKDSRPCPNVS